MLKSAIISIIIYTIIWAAALIVLSLSGGMLFFIMLILPSIASGITFAVRTRKAKRGFWQGLLILIIACGLCLILVGIFKPYEQFAGGGGFGDLVWMLGFAFAYHIIAQVTYMIAYFIGSASKTREENDGT
ncbi:MAG: hypothetical protein FWD48_00490 [Oscillospiraceae bacterium]|nr:hypothetical protein [Oscillospiraceae bacterium]